ncbi:MAG: hypothetical protein BWX48_01689 [Verrucomicrobia bacterium ADurb.Bin006]|nr:MAG: hypothetical protein BWX48_01689 [Verrucomicrobia bacterium ADurb.Bin006]
MQLGLARHGHRQNLIEDLDRFEDRRVARTGVLEARHPLDRGPVRKKRRVDADFESSGRIAPDDRPVETLRAAR